MITRKITPQGHTPRISEHSLRRHLPGYRKSGEHKGRPARLSPAAGNPVRGGRSPWDHSTSTQMTRHTFRKRPSSPDSCFLLQLAWPRQEKCTERCEHTEMPPSWSTCEMFPGWIWTQELAALSGPWAHLIASWTFLHLWSPKYCVPMSSPNLITRCVKNYFLLFALKVLPNNFIS